MILARVDQGKNIQVLEVITDELRAGNEIKLIGFGCFGIQTRKSRQGHNPC